MITSVPELSRWFSKPILGFKTYTTAKSMFLVVIFHSLHGDPRTRAVVYDTYRADIPLFEELVLSDFRRVPMVTRSEERRYPKMAAVVGTDLVEEYQRLIASA